MLDLALKARQNRLQAIAAMSSRKDGRAAPAKVTKAPVRAADDVLRNIFA